MGIGELAKNSINLGEKIKEGSNEIKNPNTENFKNIKPQEGMTKKEADKYWDDKYDKNKDSVDKARSSGEKTYVDDNGEVYRVGNKLEPSKEFEKNGYKYETDEKGRVISTEGNLRLKESNQREPMDARKAIGEESFQKGDQRGHEIADRFGGSGGIENLVPMKQELNQGDYAKLENKLADALKNGSEVNLKVEPRYEGDSKRPTEFKVTYTIDGQKDIVVFRN